MAGQKSQSGTFITVKAGVAITQRYVLIQDPSVDNGVLLPTADNMYCLGVADDTFASGAYGRMQVLCGGGSAEGVASGSITRGDLLIAASGGAVKSATGSGTENIVGVALVSVSTTEYVEFIPLAMVIAY